MFRKSKSMMICGLLSLWVLLLATDVMSQHPEPGSHLKGKAGETTLYFRKISGNRRLDPEPGPTLITENVYHALAIWGGYYVERPFELSSLGFHLHLDATILSATESSVIEVAIRRRGVSVYTSELYELPPVPQGNRELDILADLDIYPAISFNTGDDIGFYFNKIENLSPCNFLYNGPDCRDDSHLDLELSNPDYPFLETSPTSLMFSLGSGAVADSTVTITNVGSHFLHYEVKLPHGEQTLRYHDDEGAAGWYAISDQYSRDFYNARFTPAQNCTLKTARFLLSQNGSAGSPDMMVYVWDDSSGFPRAKLDSVLVPNSAITFSPTWQVVDFAGRGLTIKANRDFHIGYTNVAHSPGDALALHSDDGLPVGSQRRSSVLWNENWKTMYDQYDRDVNFMIEAVVQYGDQPVWLSCHPQSGALSSDRSQQIDVHLDAAGLSAGFHNSSLVIESDAPDRLVPVPISLQVSQTPVEQGASEIPPAGHGLSGNYPNPFNASTQVRYQVGHSDQQHVRLTIYNALGQQVRQLVDDVQEPGCYSVLWDGRSEAGEQVASGLYLYRLRVGDFRQTNKMLLIR